MTARRCGKLLISTSVLCAMVVAAVSRSESPKIFSHRNHLGFQLKPKVAISCKNCHVEGEKDKLPRLDERFCDHCHDQYGTPPWIRSTAGRHLQNITFEHSRHSRKSDCQTCHLNTAKDGRRKDGLLVSAVQCLSCHEKKTAEKRISSNNCLKCHHSDPKKILPVTHNQTWDQRHGVQAEWNAVNGHGRQCGECHGNRACVACHRSVKPKNHTGLWNIRLHGIAAEWDRDKCKTCHQTGSCVSCHRRTTPLNHRGAWKSTHGLVAGTSLNEHCLTCHQSAWCAACHRGTRR